MGRKQIPLGYTPEWLYRAEAEDWDNDNPPQIWEPDELPDDFDEADPEPGDFWFEPPDEND